MLNIEDIRGICSKLPGMTEDVKWGADLCFSIGGKMFCVTGLEGDFGVSFKVPDDDFEDIAQRRGFMPAHYAARHKWVTVTDAKAITRKDLERFVRTSYDLVSAKLSGKKRKELGLE